MKQTLNRAVARVKGQGAFRELEGQVVFTRRCHGTLVEAHIWGLPRDMGSGFFGFHIHEGGSCEGSGFPETGGHYNPTGAPHPRHAGDLPPLLACGGRAYLVVLTNRFSVEEIVGKTVVIHGSADDFRTQPSGDAGMKIGCGVIGVG